MGYMRHDAIVVTSSHRKAIKEAADEARRLGLEVLGPSDTVMNRVSTFMVCPDGSKEEWDTSNAFDAKRADYLNYLNGVRYEDNSSCLSWVAVSYSPDDRAAEVTAHAWQVPIIED